MKYDRYYNFVGILNDDSFNKLSEYLSDHQNETIFITINSGGGVSHLSKILAKMLNDRKDKISLCASGVFSAAFALFYRFEGQRFIVESTLGMYHYPYQTMDMNHNGTPSDAEGMCHKKQIKHTRSVALNFIKNFMTESETKKYQAGSNVYFTFERMKEIFPDAIVL